jgi:hypothetical protein
MVAGLVKRGRAYRSLKRAVTSRIGWSCDKWRKGYTEAVPAAALGASQQNKAHRVRAGPSLPNARR